MLHRVCEMDVGLLQCVDVSLSGQPGGFAARIPSGKLQQSLA